MSNKEKYPGHWYWTPKEYSENEKYEIELLLALRREVVEELVKKEDDLMKAAVAIVGTNVVFALLGMSQTADKIIQNSRDEFIFVFFQIFLVVAVWVVGMLAATDEDREFISGIDYILRKNFCIRSALHDGVPFLDYNWKKSVFHKTMTIAASELALTPMIIALYDWHKIGGYPTVLTAVILIEFGILVAAAIDKFSKRPKRVLGYVKMMVDLFDSSPDAFLEKYKDVIGWNPREERKEPYGRRQ